MTATAVVTGIQLTITHMFVSDHIYIWACDEWGQMLGELHVSANNGEILWVGTDMDFRRRGIATQLHQYATLEWEIPGPYHSPCRTSAGDRWREGVGGPDLP